METTPVNDGGWSTPFRSVLPLRKPQGKVTGGQAVIRSVTNLPIRAPAMDWTKLVTGEKRMFRTYAYGHNRLGQVVPAGIECPRPCVLYTRRGVEHRWETVVVILTHSRREPLGSISAEDWHAEGFRYLPGFRYYWTQRYRKIGWRPWDEITVIEVRPLTEGDIGPVGEWLFGRLYGEFVNG